MGLYRVAEVVVTPHPPWNPLILLLPDWPFALASNHPRSATTPTLPSLLLLSALSYAFYRVSRRTVQQTLSRSPLATRLLTLVYFGWIGLAATLTLLHALPLASFQDHKDADIFSKTANSLFRTVLCYSTGLRFLASLPAVRSAFPKHYAASFDGEAIWATVIHSYYLSPWAFGYSLFPSNASPSESPSSSSLDSMASLFPLMLFKYLDIATGSLGIALSSTVFLLFPKNSLSSTNKHWSVVGPAWVSWMVHLGRRSYYLWALLLGPGVPWLLWVPNCLVLLLAIGLELSLDSQSCDAASLTGYLAALPLSLAKSFSFSDPSLSIQTPHSSSQMYASIAVSSNSPADNKKRKHGVQKIEMDESALYLAFLTENLLSSESDTDQEWMLSEDDLSIDSRDSVVEDDDEERISDAEILDLVRDVHGSSSYHSLVRRHSISSRLVNLSGRVTHLQSVLFNPLERIKNVAPPLVLSPAVSSLPCISCASRSRTTVLLPCQHLCLCGPCRVSLQRDGTSNCPVCRKEIDGSVRVYWASDEE